MNATHDSPPGAVAVLIVGAGPVGMVLACELLQQSVWVRLIDAVESIDETDLHSRGILIWPRSLESLRRIGVSERLADAGHQSPGVGYYSGHRLLGTAHINRHPDSPYPFVLPFRSAKPSASCGSGSPNSAAASSAASR